MTKFYNKYTNANPKHFMIHLNEFTGPQTVERVSILAYLATDSLVEIDAIIINDDVREMDLKGFARLSFNDLETDVKEGLKWHGYRVDNSRHSIQLSYFEKFKSKIK